MNKTIKDGEYLDVVDENDEIVGGELRAVIHRDGLKHREVHVFFYCDDGIVFQHRAKGKDTYPDLLDATVGGHVERGDSYFETAVKEMVEETGVAEKDKNKIAQIAKIDNKSFDEVTQNYNNVFRMVYAYRYDGSIEDLQVEKGKAQGFVLVSWNDLHPQSEIA